GPGLVTVALSTAALLRWFLPPLLRADGAVDSSTLVRIGAFSSVAVLISFMSTALRRAQRRAEASVRELSRLAEERVRLLGSERAARADAEQAQRRFAFLAQASTLLDASLDYPTTLASLACLAVPELGD